MTDTTTGRAAAPAEHSSASDGGPIVPRADHARLRPLPLSAVVLRAEGHLGSWQELNGSATIPHCIESLETAGNLDNLRRLSGRSDKAFTGFWFADSDVHKAVEAVGWELGRRGEDEALTAFLDQAIELCREGQEDDGYLDSYFQLDHPEDKFKNLKWSHEMYCAGHLIQAAVAVARTTGREDLLGVARRFADLLVRTFGEGGVEGVDGHPEVETALVELYRLTGERSYLDLASRQVELRGHGLLGEDRFGPQYFQDHAPVREATEAIGHAVRQLYLAAGVTDVYLETGDESLLTAMEALWHSAFTEKTYVTGAHGSRHRDEAFGDPFELPPDRAYAETCAAIASFQWNWRMLLATGSGKYAEEMERALYNAVACSTSLDGNHFFYSNPLQLRPGHDGSNEDSPSERLSWYACACCPPNLARLVASLHAYVATTDATGVQLHLLSAGTVSASAPDGSPVVLDVRTDYPWSGDVAISVTASGTSTLAIRIPEWCREPQLRVAGETQPAQVDADGYLRLSRDWSGTTQLELDLPMPVRLVRAHPRVDAVRGTVSLARGPLVYAAEQADQASGVAVDDLRVDPARPPQPVATSDVPGVPVVLQGPAAVAPAAVDDLYSEVGAPLTAAVRETTLTAIPYFRWANRGPGAMRVWLPVAEPTS
jgi:uncharacterized protein